MRLTSYSPPLRGCNVRLAFYKGPPADKWHLLSHKLTCWFTGSLYSHVELVIDGMAYSSSARDGGVRAKQLDLTTGRWDVIDIEMVDPLAESDALEWFIERLGEKYDWAGVLRFVLPFVPQRSNQWFCSEAVATALGLDKPWRTSPGDLWDWAVQQPGARVVPDDELRNAWSA